MKLYVSLVSSMLLLSACAGRNEVMIEVNSQVNLLQTNEAVYYDLKHTPSFTKKGELFSPRNLAEAYEELDTLFPKEIQNALKKTAMDLRHDNNASYYKAWDQFDKASCGFLKGVINYPCFYVSDLAAYLSNAWEIKNSSDLGRSLGTVLDEEDDIMFTIIVLYSWHKSGEDLDLELFLQNWKDNF